MDAFYAAIEQRDDPALRGRPVVVGGLGRRGVVSTASYEAREFGIHSAMPTAEAHRRCPDAVFVPSRMEVYVAVSEQVRHEFEKVTPLVEPLSLDEAFLDVTASRALFGSGRDIAERIRARVREVTGLAVSIGVASCKYVAKVASDVRKPDALVVVTPGSEREFLAPLPVSRLWGAGKVGAELLRDRGYRTIGDVQAASRERLVAELGENRGAHFWALAHADDERPVVPERDPKSISHEVTFERDVTDHERCHAVLLDQSERVGRRLRRAGLRGRVVRLKLRFPPFETLARQVTLDAPTDDDLVIHRAVTALFDRARGGRPVRLLGVGVAGLTDDATGPVQRDLFGGGAAAAPSSDVLRAMDAIRDRFGENSIRHGGADS